MLTQLKDLNQVKIIAISSVTKTHFLEFVAVEYASEKGFKKHGINREDAADATQQAPPDCCQCVLDVNQNSRGEREGQRGGGWRESNV